MEKYKRVSLSKKIVLAFVLVMTLVFVGSVQSTSYAASNRAKNKKALAAYEKLLSKSTYKWSSMSSENVTKNFRFCVVDVNKDGVKDLLLTNDSACHASGYYKLLTYHKGKVKCILTGDNIGVYKKRGVVYTTFAGTGSYSAYYYKIKNGKAIEKISFKATDTKEMAKPKIKHIAGKGAYKMYYYSCVVNGKEVSYKTYKKKMKKLLKTAKESNLTYYDNTAENRATYIK
ncbi:MAG: hypothetical protein IJP29_04145 [Lachnospiraceae bacterium]|nr:hypothetical protein [Lachnospiraceae bacterium]